MSLTQINLYTAFKLHHHNDLIAQAQQRFSQYAVTDSRTITLKEFRTCCNSFFIDPPSHSGPLSVIIPGLSRIPIPKLERSASVYLGHLRGFCVTCLL